MIRAFQKVVSRIGATPETERRKDVWDLAIFGHSGTLPFTEIRQPAFREAVKLWAANELGRRRGTRTHAVHGTVQSYLRGFALLSERACR